MLDKIKLVKFMCVDSVSHFLKSGFVEKLGAFPLLGCF